MLRRLRPAPIIRLRARLSTKSPLGHSSDLIAQAYSYYGWYDKRLVTHRLLTTTLTGGILSLAGDAFTQMATQPSYDLRRGVAFTAFGATITGPVNFWWLSRLDVIALQLAPRGGAFGIGAKVAVQTLFFQPMALILH